MDHLARAIYLLGKSKDTGGLKPIQSQRFHKMIANLRSDLEEVLAYLEKEWGIKPVVIGGLAVQQYGYMRATEDIDLLISRGDYDKLEEWGKIRFGQLKAVPGIQVDMLTEGKDNNPDPEFIRDGNTVYPTFAGLIYSKINSGRHKDHTDVIELMKINGFSDELKDEVMNFLPNEMHDQFLRLWELAKSEIK